MMLRFVSSSRDLAILDKYVPSELLVLLSSLVIYIYVHLDDAISNIPEHIREGTKVIAKQVRTIPYWFDEET